MTDKPTARTASGHAGKDPEEGGAGDEPMTGAQRSYLKTLSEQANLPFDDSLSKARASERIEELHRLTGRDDPAASSAGEEDPGAALDDPAMRDAMRGEAQLRRRDDDGGKAEGGG